ncbi:MAG: hypothetical protein MUO40_07980, partial [Anaerolineaceae bacterium]|nr:hypothetical protein [Anaerolineaceae bacterium]
DILCSSATRYVLDSIGNVGWGTSIAIGADGLGVIGYKDVTNLYMKVAHCNYIHCNSATISTLDASGTVYQEKASVAIGVDGLALFSYQDFSHLKVAHCSNRLCLPINWEH